MSSTEMDASSVAERIGKNPNMDQEQEAGNIVGEIGKREKMASEESSETDVDQDCDIRQHSSYEQVMLDVNRCAGRLEHIRQVYYHRTDDDDESPEDLSNELELERLSAETGKTIEELIQEAAFVTGNKSESDEEEPKGASTYQPEESRLKAENLRSQRELKRKLAKLIVKLLIKKPDLHYYQGFHDVCLTYMTLLGEEKAYPKLDQLVDSHFNTFMRPTMLETQEFLAFIPIIVGQLDKETREFLDKSEVGVIFALSWVITWFSHVIPNERDVAKIFEFLETHDPHMVLYLCASIVVYKRDRLLELEPEMSTVHSFLCQVPRKESLPIDILLSDAIDTFTKWPPEFIRRKLDDQSRRAKLELQNYNLIRSFAHRLAPTLTNIITSNTKAAIIVLVVASAIALQFDRWTRL